MLAVRDLWKAYGDTQALAGLDLDVSAGEIVGLLGPNGAGKTTLVSIVAGLRTADAGVVAIDGANVLVTSRRLGRRGTRGGDRHARQVVGVAPQETGVYPAVRCRDQLRYFAELNGLHGRLATEAVDHVANALALTPLLDRHAQHLSGGERRRLHTAIALVHRPRLVLLDEPTTGADVQSRTHLLEFVTGLADTGSAVLYSTHYLTEIEQLGASVVLIDGGRTIARGSVGDLLATHATSVVELTFHGPVPAAVVPPPGSESLPELPAVITVDGSLLRATTNEPNRVTPQLFQRLGDEASHLAEVRIAQPSLETVYLNLTGRTYQSASQSGEEPSVVS